MAEKGGFSFSSVITSYFMVAGGFTLGMLILFLLQKSAPDLVQHNGKIFGYGLFFVGGFIGAFFAARASRGETILEPAIGAVLVVASFVGLGLATGMGEQAFGSEATKELAILGGLVVVGALIGAFLSEKVFGEATTSRGPWIIYIALSVLGACFMCTLAATILMGGQHMSGDNRMLVTLIGVAAGCLLAGMAAGASSRVRVLAAAFLGAVGGAFGFGMLAVWLFASITRSEVPAEAYTGAAIFAAGGGLVTLLGTAIGWSAIGKKSAG